MKRPTMLIEAMLQQAALDLDLSVERDGNTLIRRLEHEGLSFLTITLPLLSDSLERGLEDGRFSCPANFSRHGRLPRLLGGFFKRVFDMDGRLLDDADPDTIYWIRQICRFFKKPKIGCSPRRETQAIRNFVQVEEELRLQTDNIERDDNVLDFVSRLLWSEVLSEPDSLSLVCCHGPGVTADRYLSNERNRIRNWDDRSELSFPSDLHCYPDYGYACEGSVEGSVESRSIRYRSLSEELGVRVVFVPKTLTAPRVIAIEPAHKQFMQQGVLKYIIPILESHKLTRKSLRFSDQRPNQRLAYSSSIDRRLSTLDMKDASDRVHLHLVQRIFRHSGILEYLEDSRSLHATLPDGRNLVLWKFASMGSALCFPVEAMVFYTLIQSAMHQLDGIRPSFRSIERYSRLIDIYGDDIIVPVEYTDVVVRYLESFALKVNINKSFRNSLFRESCGADYYNGVSVKPVYARQLAPDAARNWQAEHIMAWNSTADQFYMTGRWIVAQAIRDMLVEVVGRPIPRSRTIGSGVSFFSYLFTTGLRYNSKLHCWEQKRLVFDPINRKDRIDGDAIACFNRVWSSQHFESRRDSSSGYDRKSHPFWEAITTDHNTDFPILSESRSDRVEDSISTQRECLERVLSSCESTSAEFTGNSDSVDEISALQYNDRDSPQESWFSLVRRARPVGLDFTSSTYRGRYKSKCRWVSLAG